MYRGRSERSETALGSRTWWEFWLVLSWMVLGQVSSASGAQESRAGEEKFWVPAFAEDWEPGHRVQQKH